jgi:hypothetical protein
VAFFACADVGHILLHFHRVLPSVRFGMVEKKFALNGWMDGWVISGGVL